MRFILLRSFFDDQTMKMVYRVHFIRNLFVDNCDCEPALQVRLNLLRFQLELELANFELAATILDEIRQAFEMESQNMEMLELPHQFYCPAIDLRIVRNEIRLVECLMRQTTVRQFIADDCPFGKFDDIAAILLECRHQNFDSKSLSALDQMEALVEGYWMSGRADRVEECFRWCEIGLHRSMGNLTKYQDQNQPILAHDLQHIRFFWTYFRMLVHNNRSGKFIFSKNAHRSD